VSSKQAAHVHGRITKRAILARRPVNCPISPSIEEHKGGETWFLHTLNFSFYRGNQNGGWGRDGGGGGGGSLVSSSSLILAVIRHFTPTLCSQSFGRY